MAQQQDMSLPETRHPPPGIRYPALPSLLSVNHDLQTHHLRSCLVSSLEEKQLSGSGRPVTVTVHFISWLKPCFSHPYLHLQLRAAKTVSQEEALPCSPLPAYRPECAAPPPELKGEPTAQILSPPTPWTLHLTPRATPSKHPSTHAPTIGGGLPPPSQVAGDSEMARLLVPSQRCFLASWASGGNISIL